MSNLIGHSLGRYQILEPLGEGGMAIVYKAYDTRLESEVAVKVIRIERLAPEILQRAMKRFEREAKSLAQLTHPNLVKVLDYGEYEGQPYLVMPYLMGGTLKQKMKGQPMQWQEAARLLIPIARALDYAHKRNLIHRDVKPSNILITESGEPMLTDFGVAKIIDEEATLDLTGTSAAVGTPEYMAPEQATSKNIDHRADIYALGIVFYEMVTGRRPFQADTPLAVLFKQASEPLPRPSQFIPSLPDDVEKILLKALTKRPEDRYQGMGEVVHAMESLLSGIAPTVMPQSAPSKPQAARPREKTRDTLATVNQPDTQATINQDEEATVEDTPVAGVQKPATKTVKKPAPSGILRYWPVGGILVVCILIVVLIIPLLQELSKASPPKLATEAPIIIQTPVIMEIPLDPTAQLLPTSYSVGSYSYLGQIIIDPSNSYEIIPRSVVIQEPYAYVLTRDGELFIYDLSNLGEQSDQVLDSEVNKVEIPNAEGMVIIRSNIYVFGVFMGLASLDVRNPTVPIIDKYFYEESVANITYDPVTNIVATSGYHNFATFKVKQAGGLELIFSRSLPENENFWSIATIGDFLFTGGWVESGNEYLDFFKIYDMSNPNQLDEITSLSKDEIGSESPYHIRILNSQRLITCSTSLISMWDITNPRNPMVLEKIEGGGRVCELDGNKLLLDDGRILEINDRSLSVFSSIPSLDTSDGFPYFGDISENYVLLPGNSGVIILHRQK